jgi:GTP cyclohydrolase I
MSYDKTKTSPSLGEEVHQRLVELGIETPTTSLLTTLSNKEKIEKIEKLMTEVWQTLGMDSTDDSLVDTPKRIAKMLVLDHYWGLLPENFPKNTTILNKVQCDEMVTLINIPVMSNCEHHGIVFAGSAVVSYIPDKKVIV